MEALDTILYEEGTQVPLNPHTTSSQVSHKDTTVEEALEDEDLRITDLRKIVIWSDDTSDEIGAKVEKFTSPDSNSSGIYYNAGTKSSPGAYVALTGLTQIVDGKISHEFSGWIIHAPITGVPGNQNRVRIARTGSDGLWRIVIYQTIVPLTTGAVNITPEGQAQARQNINALEDEAGVIDEKHLATGAVTQTKIADGAVTTSKVQDLAVTEDKLASQSVSSSKIKDNTIGASKLGTNSVTQTKIQSRAVTEIKIADYAVSVGKIANGAVTAAKLYPGASNPITLKPDTQNVDDNTYAQLKIPGVNVIYRENDDSYRCTQQHFTDNGIYLAFEYLQLTPGQSSAGYIELHGVYASIREGITHPVTFSYAKESFNASDFVAKSALSEYLDGWAELLQGDTSEVKSGNLEAIQNYITKLQALGVEGGKILIPVMLDGEYAGFIQQVNSTANWYAGVLKGGSQISVLNGEVTVKDFCYNNPSGLTTNAQTVVGAINEVNAKVSDAQGVHVHNAGDDYSDTLPDEVTTAEPFRVETILIGAWNNNTYKAQILTGINTSDRTIKQYQRTSADNGINWTEWTVK